MEFDSWISLVMMTVVVLSVWVISVQMRNSNYVVIHEVRHVVYILMIKNEDLDGIFWDENGQWKWKSR